MAKKQEIHSPRVQSGRTRSDVTLRAYRSVEAGARRRVLVVDDDPLIRRFTARALTGAGYDVTQAESAEQALAVLVGDGASFAFMLSDVGLPGASGAELVEQARSLLPALPTLLMSAMHKHWLVSRGILAHDIELLQKPFKIADLLTRLEQLLAQPLAP